MKVRQASDAQSGAPFGQSGIPASSAAERPEFDQRSVGGGIRSIGESGREDSGVVVGGGGEAGGVDGGKGGISGGKGGVGGFEGDESGSGGPSGVMCGGVFGFGVGKRVEGHGEGSGAQRVASTRIFGRDPRQCGGAQRRQYECRQDFVVRPLATTQFSAQQRQHPQRRARR